MDFFLLLTLACLGLHLSNQKQQRQRIALLAQHLRPYQIEQLMESLTQGYLRAMGEADAERRRQVLDMLCISERQLAEQFERLAGDFARLPEAQTRVSRVPIGLPFALLLFPAASFDMRQLLRLHAEGIARVTRNDAGQTPRDKAYRMTAEILLMQHSCHWFCKSLTVASARVLARHQTSHTQLVDAVSPQTRLAYLALTGLRR